MKMALLIAALMVGAAAPPPIEPKVQGRIDRILKHTPLIDGHNDLPWELREKYESRVDGIESGGELRKSPLMTDIARLRAGRVGGQFWSVYIDADTHGDEAIRQTIEQIDLVDRLVAAYPRDLALALTADDLVRAHKSGRIASLIGIEGGHQIGGSLAALRQFYRLGARYMTLTHFKSTEWADSATDAPKHDGLAPFGLTVVGEMNRLGMLVDLSHVSEATMNDVLDSASAPVIFSHSGAQAINPHPRNVSDSVLRRLPANGGVVMVDFYPGYVSPGYRLWSVEKAAQSARLKALMVGRRPDELDAAIARWVEANPAPEATIGQVADHIEHVAKVAGHDHVGIGGDLDGIDVTIAGLGSVDGYPLLFAELIRRGWSDSNLARLAGGNVLRALRQAEAVARSKKAVPPALDEPR